MKSARNIRTGSLWGELPARETFKQEVITPDNIENVWRQVMEESSNMECDFPADRQTEYIRLPMGNLHVLNTINFHQQLRMMEDGIVLGNISTIEAEETPEESNVEKSFQFSPAKTERNVFKNSSAIRHLTSQTAHDVLKHAVVTLLAHIGFEKSTDIAVETLTDAADHFLRRITLLMKAAHEQNVHGFPDIVQKVLLEVGVGGVADLHNYYQEYVLKFEENMRKEVLRTMEKQRIVLDEAAKLQFEELDEFGNVCREVPTLQLLDPEMGFPPSLDAGFQMLYNLEQDELKNLEVEEEEVNVSDSPNTGHRPDVPIDKKKS